MKANKPEYNIDIEGLFGSLGLGGTMEITQIFGGHLHKMFKVVTENGSYAVKALNPGVTARPEAMSNFVNSEKIAQKASEKLSVSNAKLFNGEFLLIFNGQRYMIFDFAEGKPLVYSEITPQHCKLVGKTLAKLHETDFSELDLPKDGDEGFFADWEFYLERAIKTDAAWKSVLADNIEEIYDWNLRLGKATEKLSFDTVSHRDLEPKNVMWNGMQPLVVDWEAAGYTDKSFDILDAAVCWSRDGAGSIAFDKLDAFLDGYKSVSQLPKRDYAAAADRRFILLDWLEFSLRRSLMLDPADEAERKMGSEQIGWVIDTLKAYDSQIPEIIAHFQ